MKKLMDWVKDQWNNKGAGGKGIVVGIVAVIGLTLGFLVFKAGKKKGRWT